MIRKHLGELQFSTHDIPLEAEEERENEKGEMAPFHENYVDPSPRSNAAQQGRITDSTLSGRHPIGSIENTCSASR